MKTFLLLLTLYEGNPLFDGEFPSQKVSHAKFDAFCVDVLNKRYYVIVSGVHWNK